MGGNFQALISAGKYFTASEFFASEFKLAAHKIGAGDVKLQTALMRYFLPLTEGAVSNEIRTLSLSKVSQASFSEMMMVLMRKAEHAIQYTIFNSMMENAMVENGQIVNIREYLRNQPEFKNRYSADAATRRALEKGFEAKVSELQATRSLYKIAELKGDELHIPGIDRKSDSVIKYRNLIHQLSKNATGNVTEDDMSKIRMNVITRSFMVFKNWIPRLVDVRVGELRYNVGTDAYEWGRMRMVAKMLFSEGFFALNRLKNVLSANDKGVEYLTKLYEQKKADYELANNTEFTMSKEEFFDMVRAGIKAQFRDTLVLTSLVALFLFLKAEAPDDDEDKETISRYKYAVRVMDKIIDEISFYYNPISFQQILNGSVFPALGVVTDMAKLFNSVGEELYGLTFNDEEVTESAKPIKYVLKTFPISHQFLTFVPLLDPEMAKELGVKTTTESRLR
jgi:predicted CopG family antitoxin